MIGRRQALRLAAAGLDLKTAEGAVLVPVAFGAALSSDAAVATAVGLPAIAALAAGPLAGHLWRARNAFGPAG